jgi:hypothetical protein
MTVILSINPSLMKNLGVRKTTFSSSITHGAQSGCPMLIAPKMGIEIRSPLFPSCTYSALLASTDFLSDSGMACCGKDIFIQ